MFQTLLATIHRIPNVKDMKLCKEDLLLLTRESFENDIDYIPNQYYIGKHKFLIYRNSKGMVKIREATISQESQK